MSFADLKRNRSATLDDLKAKAEAASGGKKSYDNDKYWAPARDKAGNGYAEVRFLPAPEGEVNPWITYFDHGFQGPTGMWYIENSLTTIGQDDPVSELNSKLWNTGRDEDKETARKQKRRLHYVANVLVIKDPANPANEGKVVLYRFGKKIFDKIKDAMQPQYEDETPVNPFDLWEGATFKIKIRQVEGWVNYDKSEFAAPSELFDGDEAKLEELYKSINSLQALVDPSTFKTYAELKLKLNKVLGTEVNEPAAEPRQQKSADPKPDRSKAKEEEPEADEPADDEEDPLSYFKKQME